MQHFIPRAGATALLAALGLMGSSAHAQGLMVEGNLARSHGNWGAELGGGLDFQSGPFTLRPIVGAFVADETRVYVKGEATVTIPAVAEIGAGARFISDQLRAYGTVAVPIGPALRLKGNLGDGYGAVGLNLRF